MTSRIVLFRILLILISSGVLWAAGTEVPVGEDTFYLNTNSVGGECRTREIANGKFEVVCEDNDVLVAMNSELGCLDSYGSGYCARNEKHEADVSAMQLTCPENRSIYLHSGIWSDNECRRVEDTMICESDDGVSSAEANCKSGCMMTRGSGVCCIAAKGHCENARITAKAEGDP